VSSKADVAQYAIRAASLAYADPVKFPSRIRVYSDNRTWNEYATIMEGVSGIKLTRKYIPLAELSAAYEASLPAGDLLKIISLLAAEGVLDSDSAPGGSSNELLNPGERYFKPKTIDEYAKEVGGRPWLTGNPFA